MAETKAEIEKKIQEVKDAMHQLALGPGPNGKNFTDGKTGRIRTFSFSDGAVRTFAEVTMKELSDYRDYLQAQLSQFQTDITKRRPGVFRGATSKGL